MLTLEIFGMTCKCLRVCVIIADCYVKLVRFDDSKCLNSTNVPQLDLAMECESSPMTAVLDLKPCHAESEGARDVIGNSNSTYVVVHDHHYTAADSQVGWFCSTHHVHDKLTTYASSCHHLLSHSLSFNYSFTFLSFLTAAIKTRSSAYCYY